MLVCMFCACACILCERACMHAYTKPSHRGRRGDAAAAVSGGGGGSSSACDCYGLKSLFACLRATNIHIQIHLRAHTREQVRAGEEAYANIIRM